MDTELVVKINQEFPIYSIGVVPYRTIDLEEIYNTFKDATSSIRIEMLRNRNHNRLKFDFEGKTVTPQIIQAIGKIAEIKDIYAVPSLFDYDLKQVRPVLNGESVDVGVAVNPDGKYVLWFNS
jgi:hypothetical protein